MAFSKKKECNNRYITGTLFSLQAEWLFIKAILFPNGKTIYLLQASAVHMLHAWLSKIIKWLVKNDYCQAWEKDSGMLLIIMVYYMLLVSRAISTRSARNNLHPCYLIINACSGLKFDVFFNYEEKREFMGIAPKAG